MQGAVADDGVDSMPLELLIVGVEMLYGRDHTFALNSLDIGNGHAAGEVRILTEAFEISAPERGAIDVHRWPQDHIPTESLDFLPDRLAVCLRQFGIPCGAQGDARGK